MAKRKLKLEQQESLADAKVSARQPWYIGYIERNSLNRPPLIGSSSNINVIYMYTLLKSTFSAQQLFAIFIRLAVVASQTSQLAQLRENLNLQ